MSDLILRILLQAQDQASKTIKSVGNDLEKLSATDIANGIGATAGAMLGLGVAATGAAVVLGGLAVKSAGDYKAGLTSLSTGANELQSNLDMVGASMLQMAVDTGTNTKQLEDGMFLIESAGDHGADGLRVLKAAAEGAKVGVADLGVVANADTTILTDYHLSTEKATQVTNALLTTVSDGKTHLQDLASSMGSILPLASSLNISFPQVGGAIAVMTNAGMDAQRAAQDLNNAIRSLAAPNAAAEKSMRSVGISAQDLKDTLSTKGLTAAIQMVEEHVNKSFPAGSVQAVEAFKKIMGGATGYNVALMLGGQNMKTFENNVNDITNAMNTGGNSVKGWAQVQQDFNFKMSQAKEVIETLGIKIGQQLMPLISQLVANVTPTVVSFGNWVVQSGVLTTIFGVLITVISTLVVWISNTVQFFQQNQAALVALEVVLIAVAGVIAGLLVFAFIAWAEAAWAAAVATVAATWPFMLVGTIIALVVAGIILAITHWGQITDWLKGVWSNVVGFFQMIWNGLLVGLHAVGDFFVHVWQNIVSQLQMAWNIIVNVVRIGIITLLVIIFAPIIAIAALFIWLYQHNTYFKMMIDNIVMVVKVGVAWLVMAWQVTIAWLVGAWQAVVGFASAVWSNVVKTIQDQFNMAIAIVVAVWTFISSLFMSAYTNYLVRPLTAAWDAVSSFFGGIWNNYIKGPLEFLWNAVLDYITQFGNGALKAGENFITMLVQGIESGAGAIWNAVTGIASTIWKALGFHSPAEAGPGATAHEWMPNLITLLSDDLRAGAPQMQAAAIAVAQPLAITLGGGISPSSRSTSSGGGISITINIDGRSARTDQDLVNMLMDKLSRELNRSGSIAPWISGGRA